MALCIIACSALVSNYRYEKDGQDCQRGQDYSQGEGYAYIGGREDAVHVKFLNCLLKVLLYQILYLELPYSILNAAHSVLHSLATKCRQIGQSGRPFYYKNRPALNFKFKYYLPWKPLIHLFNYLQLSPLNISLQMDIKPTKQMPGPRVEIQQSILQQFTFLNPKYKKTVPFFGGHPLSMTKKDQNKIFQQRNVNNLSPYLVCEKTDGVRYILVVTNQFQYLISREGSKNLIAYKSYCKIAKNWHKNPQGQFKQIIHILDGEMINDQQKNGQDKLKYLIFDALVVFNKKIIDRPLKDRLQWCEKVARCNQFLLQQADSQDFQNMSTIDVKVKDFFRLNCNSFVSSQIMHNMRLTAQPTAVEFLQKYYINALPHKNDGLIFNHQEKPYILGRNPGYLKWKPAQLNTVDFLIVPNTKVSDKFERRILDLYLGWRDAEILTYKILFYNFTVVSEDTFKQLQEEYNRKYERAYEENPDLVTQANFGIIAQCKYEKVTPGSEQANLFKSLLSSTKDPKQIQSLIMRQQNEQKEQSIIKKIQGEPYTKYWQILRIRIDKNTPNDQDVVNKIEQSIKDDIKYEDLVKKNYQLIDLLKIK